MSPTVETFPHRVEKSWLDRVLSIVTDVHSGEGFSALLLTVNIFYLMAFYYVLKVVRDALILSQSGAAAASYTSAGQAILLLALIPAYGAVASRVNRLTLVCGVTLFFASNLVIFYVLGNAGVRLGIAFYLWAGVFNMMAVAQFWAFANDLYTPERGKRLFPLLGVGMTLGALVGSAATKALFGGMGPYTLMLIAAAGLLIPVGLTIWVHFRERAAKRDAAAAEAEQPLGKIGGFELILKQRYLLYLALFVLMLNLVNTIGQFVWFTKITSEAVSAVAPDVANGSTRELSKEETEAVAKLIGPMNADLFTWVNLLAFLFQTFLVSRIFKYVGVRGAMFILPIVALAGYSMIAIVPVLGVIRLAKIAENSTDYSISNTTRNALFLPLSREAKYKAKQAIDAFFVRTGDLLQAGVVFVGTTLAFGIRQYAILNIVFVGVWLVLALAIAREHRKLVPADTVKEAA
jgi:ATP:ADP antiporter, AAA family